MRLWIQNRNDITLNYQTGNDLPYQFNFKIIVTKLVLMLRLFSVICLEVINN